MNTPKKYTFDEVLENANTSLEFKEEYDKELERLRTSDWEKDFEDKFSGLHTNVSWGMEECDCDPIDPGEENTCTEKIKRFIRNLLAQSRLQYQKELVERVEAMEFCTKSRMLALLKD